MPRQRMLPYGDFDYLKIFTSREALDAVESRYGLKLNKRVRALIYFSTVSFSADVQIEATAPSKETVKKIKRLLKLTLSLKKEFPRAPSTPSFRKDRHVVKYLTQTKDQWEHFALPYWLGRFAEQLEDDEDLIRRILERSPGGNELTKGKAWDAWVVTLRQVLTEAQLPTEVRKDGLGDSKFVKFVDELQKQLPNKLKPLVKTRSLEALAKAIDRAVIDSSSHFEGVPIETLLKIQIGVMKPILLDDNKLAFEIEPKLAKSFDEIMNRANSLSL